MPTKAKAKQTKVQAKKAPQPSKSKAKAPAKKPSPPKPASKTKPKTPAPKSKPDTKVPAPKSKSTDKTPAKKPSPPKPAPKRPAPSTDNKNAASSGVKKTKSEEQIVKVVTKGGAAVDALVPSKDNYRVYQDGGKTYSATLNQSNLQDNNNKFYIIQILQNESNSNLFVWNRWGRVGVPGQNALKGPMPKDACIRDYTNKYHDKAIKGDYRQIEIKYDEDDKKQEQKPKAGGKPKKEVQSKMDKTIQNLISLIFDVTIMNNTMKQIGYDAKKMPLGRLGESTIKQAYGVLNQLSQAVKKKDNSAMMKLSGDFYSLIPHDFGFQKMSNFVLNNEQKVKEKLNMLSTISDLKITSKLLDQKNDEDTSVLDQNYKKLACDIKPVDKSTNDYKLLREYFDNTKGNYGKVQISDMFEVTRPAQQKVFNNKLGNNMLLWHGSRVSNFVGILSQGMRIAPPEAPASGYLFGKGIYLADMAQKSINYCRAYGQSTALILLLEGALGKPNILKSTNCGAKQDMERNKKDSTKYEGGQAPPASSYVDFKGMTVPKGKPPGGSGGWGRHNEYIVYNINQARIRYILRMQMNGQ